MARQHQKRQESIIQGVYISPDQTGDNIEALRMAMYGYDYTNSMWRRIAVDENGQLLGVGGSGGGTSSVYDTAVYDTGVYA